MKKYFDYIKMVYNTLDYASLYDDKFENVCGVCGNVTYHSIEPKDNQGCCRSHTCQLRKVTGWCWMNHDNINYKISKDDIDKMIGKGYTKGRF